MTKPSTNPPETAGNSRLLTRTLIIIATIAIAFSMVWFNTYRRSAKYYNAGMESLAAGNLLDAVTRFEIAAHAYTPWNRYITDSLEKLWEIGRRFETEKKNPAYALIAYRSLRSSIYATRSFYMPNARWIPRCDERIKALVAIQKEQETREISDNATPPPAETPSPLP